MGFVATILFSIGFALFVLSYIVKFLLRRSGPPIPTHIIDAARERQRVEVSTVIKREPVQTKPKEKPLPANEKESPSPAPEQKAPTPQQISTKYEQPNQSSNKDVKKPKKTLSPEEKKAKKEKYKREAQELKEKRLQKEKLELMKLMEEKKRQKEEEEARRRAREEELERKAKEEEEERRRILEEKRHARLAEEAEKQRLKEEEERKQREEEERKRIEDEKAREAAKPKPKLAWGGAATVRVEPISLTEIQEKERSSTVLPQRSNKEEEEVLARLREERRRHRKLLKEKRERERFDLEQISPPSKAHIEAREAAERIVAEIRWDGNLELKQERHGVYTVTGVPESAHALLIGESGTNISVFRNFNVRLFLSGPTIRLEGASDDVLIAFEKLKLVMEWKFYLDERKQYELKTNADSHTAAIHQNVIELLKQRVASCCFRFHNEGFGKTYLDLSGLHDQEALDRLESRLDELERLPISSLPSDQLEILVAIPRNGPPVPPLERAVTALLKQYHFTWDTRTVKAHRILTVQL